MGTVDPLQNNTVCLQCGLCIPFWHTADGSGHCNLQCFRPQVTTVPTAVCSVSKGYAEPIVLWAGKWPCSYFLINVDQPLIKNDEPWLNHNVYSMAKQHKNTFNHTFHVCNISGDSTNLPGVFCEWPATILGVRGIRDMGLRTQSDARSLTGISRIGFTRIQSHVLLVCRRHHTKRSLMAWVGVIPKEGSASVAEPILLLVWHRLFRIWLCYHQRLYSWKECVMLKDGCAARSAVGVQCGVVGTSTVDLLQN